MKKDEAQKNVYGRNVPEGDGKTADGIREEPSQTKKRPEGEKGAEPAAKTEE